VDRDALRDQDHLLAQARKKALPPLLPVYSSGGIVIPLGTVTCRTGNARDLKSFAKKNHLAVHQVKEGMFRLELTENSRVDNVFEVARQVWKEVDPTACSPDFLRKLNR
jgi:hypothetical protein